jgi:replicative DNA helicase
MKDDNDYSGLVFTPLEASNAAEEYIENIKANDGDVMPLYIPKLEYNEENNKGFLPVKRGELITVLGRPGSGKTGFMFHWARRRAQDLKIQNSDKVVLYWSMEQLIEELRLFNVAGEDHISASKMAMGKMADTEWDRAVKSLRGLHTTPLWFAGKSLKRRKQKIQLDENSLRGTLASIEKWQGETIKQEIDSVFIDYLQRFRSNGRDWVQFYGDLTNGLKDMAGDFATRFVVGVQARREVDAKAIQIPGMEDGQWTSSIEQQSDGMLSVVRPSRYRKDGEDFDGTIVKGYRQMVIKVLKRKLGPEGQATWVNFEPEYNKLDDMDVETIQLAGGYHV